MPQCERTPTMKRLRCVVPDVLPSTLIMLLAVVASNVWTPVSGKVLATQMSARVVETQYGKLRGVLVTLSNRRLPLVEAYLGLQYASLLGGELRFMPPTSTTEKWDGIRVALRYRPVCPQTPPPPPPPTNHDGTVQTSLRADHIERLRPFLERQSEECLNLNIYVPAMDGRQTLHHRRNKSSSLSSSLSSSSTAAAAATTITTTLSLSPASSLSISSLIIVLLDYFSLFLECLATVIACYISTRH